MVKLRIVDVSPKPKDGNCGRRPAANFPTKACWRPCSWRKLWPPRMPCIIRGLSLGPCVDNLAEARALRPSSSTAPSSRDADLDFVLPKNFAYKTVSLAQLVQRASRSVQPEGEYFLCPEERYYLRRACMGGDSRSEPAPAGPPVSAAGALSCACPISCTRQSGSSPPSCPPPASAWLLHYDVMDNLLCGVGDKSRVANPDNYDAAEFPDFAKATPFTGDLLPGDVLYIPAMWFHSVLNVTYTLSVNVFWKTLRDELYDPKDAYGNKEPSLQSGLKTVTASGLPPEYCHVYGVQLANLIRERLCDGGAGSGQDQSAAE
uniref:JmjC domain-containing protein n=1 Tax=Macrostomum lignano TaxID=282301 RepID=A0A1I8FK85_9PLAT